jgi:hypothetical protein
VIEIYSESNNSVGSFFATTRDLRILDLKGRGRNGTQIADELHISPIYLRKLVHFLRRKNSLPEGTGTAILIGQAIRLGLIQPHRPKS